MTTEYSAAARGSLFDAVGLNYRPVPWAEFSSCMTHGDLCHEPACAGRRYRYYAGGDERTSESL